MKKQKKIELLTDFQLFLYEKGFIEDYLWEFEKQAKKFVKKLKSQKRLEDLIENDKKKIEIQFEFDTLAAFESFSKQLVELQENLSKIKISDRGDKNPLDIENPLPYVTVEKATTEINNGLESDFSKWLKKYPSPPVETGKGRRLYSKCNRGDVVRSYVEESNLNKGFYVLVIQCRNGKKYVVSGDHYAPTYLQPYNQSSDTKETNNEK